MIFYCDMMFVKLHFQTLKVKTDFKIIRKAFRCNRNFISAKFKNFMKIHAFFSSDFSRDRQI